MSKKVIFSLLTLISVSWGQESAPVVCLISPPRSLSVGFLRMIEARGDFKIFHESTIGIHHRVHNHTFCKDWFVHDPFQTFDQLKQTVFQQNSPVFMKEMAFSLATVIDEDFIQRENVYFVFLLRNPHDAIVSLYHKIGSIVEDFHEAVGYQSSYELFQRIQQSSRRPPLILFSEELASQPEKVVREFCDYVNLPFLPESLSWKSLNKDFSGQTEWHEIKRTDLTQHWHDQAIQSTQFKPLTSYEVDEKGYPTFSEIEDPQARRECEKAYRNHLPYYEAFRALQKRP